MSKLRSVNTHFWSDTYIADLDPIEKLLFIYLLTNEQTNMLGIYELHARRIAFDTGIDKDMVLKIFSRFEADNKAKYVDGYVVLRNFTKHQSYNTNMKVSAVNTWKNLPENVRNDDFCEPTAKALEGFTKASEPTPEIEVELEREIEVEGESKKQRVPTLESVIEYFVKNGYTEEAGEKMFNYYDASRGANGKIWKDSKGNTVKNWKMKAQAIWFKEENKEKAPKYPTL